MSRLKYTGFNSIKERKDMISDSKGSVGKRVILITNRYRERKSNPVWNGPYGKVVGTVVSVNGQDECHIRVAWDNGTVDNYTKGDLNYYKSFEGANMITSSAKKSMELIKDSANKLHVAIKPYEKYIGLVALALVIDYFLLNGKYMHKFRDIADRIVKKISAKLDALLDRLDLGEETAEKDGE